ncbi:unnamed protein product [Moneuplotes crassus]|uniref:uridine/cytidine kinase n=2 Tax=Euplotes crassus TaxID=5936 RepID=A0AAD1UUK3_EUPCR|nr:unnamed protein product [Moneuplotes crassus]
MLKPYFIGITGGTASGKTTLCREIFENLSVIDDCVLLSMDNFYKGLSQEDHDDAANYNFDHPDALDFDEIYEVVLKLLRYEDAEIPNYDFSTHQRTSERTKIYKSYFILFEGILALHDKRIRDLMDLKIFVQEDDDVRLCRRIRRDISERGRDLMSVINQWHGTVKSSFDEFIKPTAKYADLIVQGNETNKNAIQFMVDSLTKKMISLGIAKRQFEVEESKSNSTIAHEVHSKMDKDEFDRIVSKLIEEKEFKDIYLTYLIKKLKEFYSQSLNDKVTLIKNISERAVLKTGNLIKTKSVGGVATNLKTLTVFTPSLITEEEIKYAHEKVNLIDLTINKVVILSMFGDQTSLQEQFEAEKDRSDLEIEVLTIGSTPLLLGYQVDVDSSNSIFISEFKG